jgi:predicted amidohydrolase YtcJ
MKIINILLFGGILFFGLSCQINPKKDLADLVLYNGAIWTVNDGRPWVEAAAVKENKIIEVGSNKDILKLASEETERIDLEGAFVLPGFIDSHTHFLDGGFSLSSVQLRGAKSREDFIHRIEERAKAIEKGEWILNGDWDHQQFDPPVLPRKEWIDQQTADNPVCISRHDGHMVLVNSLALKIAGLSKDTPTPPGGEIIKDAATGEPTGILKDAAMDLVTQHIPEPSSKEKLAAAQAALKHAAENGITSIHEMAYADNLDVYEELLKQGRLTARLNVYIQITEFDSLESLNQRTTTGNDILKVGGLKGFVDGSLGSATALFFDPYIDQPDKTGILYSHMFPEGIMEKRLRQADQAGAQVAIHAIGDKANHIILDIFEGIASEGGQRDRRWRIEHAQHLIPEDIGRFGELGIIASIQPYHAIDDGRWAEKKIGRKRAQYTYIFRSLLEGGAILACGSDWTVAPLDPITGIYAAVTRRTLDGKNPDGWFPEQKIALEEAIKGYTLNGAYTEFSEDSKGSLEKGKLADFVVLDKNLFSIAPEDIQHVKVEMTIFNGKIVFRKKTGS